MFDFPGIGSIKSLDPFFNIPNAPTTIGNVIVLSCHILFISISKSLYFANFHILSPRCFDQLVLTYLSGSRFFVSDV